MAKKRYYSKAMEARDAGMIPSSRGIAMMPQTVVYREYAPTMYNGFEGLNDTLKGVDVQMDSDLRLKKTGKFPGKF